MSMLACAYVHNVQIVGHGPKSGSRSRLRAQSTVTSEILTYFLPLKNDKSCFRLLDTITNFSSRSLRCVEVASPPLFAVTLISWTFDDIWCLGSLRAAGGVVEAGPSYQKSLSEEVTKLQRLYGGGDLTKFPDFKFSGEFGRMLLRVFVSSPNCVLLLSVKKMSM